MALPITAGALLYKSRELEPAEIDRPFLLGIVVSGATGALAIRLLLRYLAHDRNSLLPFALYRCILAALIVGLSRGRRVNIPPDTSSVEV
jgi:undecaprenyl pyrophosphate phosphatase UppP